MPLHGGLKREIEGVPVTAKLRMEPLKHRAIVLRVKNAFQHHVVTHGQGVAHVQFYQVNVFTAGHIRFAQQHTAQVILFDPSQAIAVLLAQGARHAALAAAGIAAQND